MKNLSIEKLLQSQGFGSRKTCRNLVLDGRVTVNGADCLEPDAEFMPDNLDFSVGGKPWRYRAQAYLVLHKPAGYECSHQPQHHPSVFSLLPAPLILRGVQCVGRLDQDTTGLLLLSDDGAFIHRYSAPKKKIDKVYRVTVKHLLQPEQIAALLEGVLLHDEPAPLAAVACVQIAEKRVDLTIAEGKYHQVKRMIAAAGNRVEGLHRIAVGGYTLDADLPSSSWKWLEPEDLQALEMKTP